MPYAPSDILDHQLALLDQHTSPERWKHDHELATYCWVIKDVIALALETLDRIKKHCDHYNAAVVAGKYPASDAETQSLLAYWKRWHQIALRALDALEWIERQGFSPEGFRAFRFAINEAALTDHWDRVIAVHHRLHSHGGRTLEAIDHELSRHAG